MSVRAAGPGVPFPVVHDKLGRVDVHRELVRERRACAGARAAQAELFGAALDDLEHGCEAAAAAVARR